MSQSAFPNSWPGTSTTGHRNIGATQRYKANALGFPASWPGTTTVNYRNIGAVQKQPLFQAQETNGSFTFTGETINALVSRLATINNGSFVLTGEAINALAARLATISNGSFTLTGQDLAAIILAIANLSAGTFALTGQQLAAIVSRLLAAGYGSFVLNGQSINLEQISQQIAKDLAWILKLVEADEIHNSTTGQITKRERGTATELLTKAFSGQPFLDLSLTHVSSGDDSYSGASDLVTLAAMIAEIRSILEADETQTGSTLTKYTKATVTPILTKNVTGTPLIDLQAIE